MNCETYLSILETAPVDDLMRGDARAHAIGCHDCYRVTTVVVERERQMSLAFNDVSSPLAWASTAEQAIETSRRRRVATYYRIGLGAAAAAILIFGVATRRVDFLRDVVDLPYERGDVRITEKFRLNCLSPENAAHVVELANTRSAKLWIGPGKTAAVVTVEGPTEVIAEVRTLLSHYDAASPAHCDAQLPVPGSVAPR